MATKPACAGCGKRDEKHTKCARCKTVFYCGAECQKQDWKTHKRDCQKLGSEEDPNEAHDRRCGLLDEALRRIDHAYVIRNEDLMETNLANCAQRPEDPNASSQYRFQCIESFAHAHFKLCDFKKAEVLYKRQMKLMGKLLDHRREVLLL